MLFRSVVLPRERSDEESAKTLSAVLPVVLAGSVLATAGPLRDEVRAGLHAQGRTVRTATTGLPGALLLAREHAARMASDPRR